MFADKDILDNKSALCTIADWRSWKLERVARSSLAAEAQTFNEAHDMQEWINLFFWECLEPEGLDFRHHRQEILANLPPSPMVTDCKSLYDVLTRNESAGLGASEKRTAIELLAARQRME